MIWVIYGYSMAFTDGGSMTPFVGGFTKAFLNGVDADSTAATFSNGVVIPELAYIVFQMTFAMITPALIVGAFAERIKFSAVMLFILLWVTFVYFPIAHMVWYLAGSGRRRRRRQGACGRGRRRCEDGGAGQARRSHRRRRLARQAGALDFAGGTVVHINAGIAGLVGCLIIGKRVGYGKEPMAPHSLTMTMIGASLLWVGWFGFNAGSNLEANGTTALAFVNTLVATAGAALLLAVRRMDRQGQALAARHAARARSPASSPSRRPPASPARWARSCSASWSRRSACSSSPR